jgi:hypothetical protein
MLANEVKRNTLTEAYKESYTLACRKFLAKDIFVICRNAGASITKTPENIFIITINFLSKRIKIPGFIFIDDLSKDLNIWEKIIILHYLIGINNIPLSNSLINFKQISAGRQYYPAFEKRTIKPLLAVFANNPQKTLKASKGIGGTRVDLADIAVKIMAFPLVPVFLLLWKGDDEFPPNATILFDASIDQRLCAEDIAVLCQQIVFKIIKEFKQS